MINFKMIGCTFSPGGPVYCYKVPENSSYKVCDKILIPTGGHGKQFRIVEISVIDPDPDPELDIEYAWALGSSDYNQWLVNSVKEETATTF